MVPIVSDDTFMTIADHFAKLIEVCAGHREKAIAAGFTPAAAEQMAVQIHAVLVEVINRGTKK